MARIKQEINSKSRERLKRICEDLHITQKQLSGATGISDKLERLENRASYSPDCGRNH